MLKLSDADETEVDIGATTDALTRFANNTIHQNVAEEILGISIRTVVDGRTARSTTNKTDDDSLAPRRRRRRSLARNQPENPDLLPMLRKQKYEKVSRFFSATAETTPQDRARAVARVCKMADKRKQTAAGIFASGSITLRAGEFEGSFRSLRADAIGIFRHDSRSALLGLGESRIRPISAKSIRKRWPKAPARRPPIRESRVKFRPGRYTTILEPSAVLDLVGFLFYDFAGTAVLDKRSCFTGRMGKKLFGDNITLWDDAYHPLQSWRAL